MANADSSATALRLPKDALVRPLARVVTPGPSEASGPLASAQRAARSPAERRLASGIYRFVTTRLLRADEYAGLESLDRAELDETDEG